MRDFRHALRAIARMPVLSAVIVISIAFGIGANTIVFSWMQARVLRPLPGVPWSASLRGIEPRTDAGGYPGASWLEFRDLRAALGSFEHVIAFRPAPMYLGAGAGLERHFGMLVSGNYFDALGLRPAAGRLFTEAEADARADVTVISYAVWQSAFGGADIAGRTVRVNGRELAVLGVTPREFQGTVMGLNFSIWTPATSAPLLTPGSRELDDRQVRGYQLLGRLAPHATDAAAQAELDAAMARLRDTYPAANAGIGGRILRFWELPRGPQRMMTMALAALQVVMLLLLAAVCGNIANLLLARASTRRREVGVRLALGAGPLRVARLLVAEALVLSIAGSVLGAAIAAWGMDAFMTMPLTGLPLRFETNLDAGGLAFTLVLGIACGVAVAAVPALSLARMDPSTALRAGVRTRSRARVRQTLMALQVGLAVIVLMVAGLFIAGFMQSRQVDPGFRRDGILLGAYDLTGRSASAEAVRTFAPRVLQRLQGAPGVAGAAIASAVPLDIHGLPPRAFRIEGRPRIDGGVDRAPSNVVTPGYFDVLDIRLTAGSDFVPLDDTVTAPQAIVNEAFVRRYFADDPPLGRALTMGGRRYTVAGVVETTVSNAFGEAPTPVIYLSYRDNPSRAGEIHLRGTTTDAAALTSLMREAVRGVDAELPVFNVRSLERHVASNLVFRSIPARMFAVLGPWLLFLAAVGVYAVVDHATSQRTSELGVRLALGATPRQLATAVVGEHLTVALAGAAAGWLLAVGTAVAFLPNAAFGGAVFTLVPLLLLLVVALASWLPARRAAAVDPLVALRAD